MPISVTTEPPTFSFTENPILIEMTTTEHVAIAGVAGRWLLTWSTGFTQGVFQFRWLNNSIVLEMALVAAPDSSGLQIKYSTLASGFIGTDFVPAMKRNYLFDRDFEIEQIGSDRVQITARNVGVEYTLAVQGLSGYAAPVLSTIFPPVTQTYKENYKLGAHLRYNRLGGTAYTEALLELEPLSGKVTFDLASFLNGDIPDSPIPAYSLPGMLNLPEKVIEYYLEYFEGYGVPFYWKIKNSYQKKYALHGGFRWADTFENSVMTDFLALTGRYFLSWKPLVRKMAAGQRDYLSVVNMTNATKVRLKVEFLFVDATTAVVNSYTLNTGEFHYITVPLFYDYLAGLNNTGKEVVEIRVWLATDPSGAKVTEKLTLVLADDNVPVEISEILYRNSLGAYEVVTLTGNTTHIYEGQNERATQKKDKPLYTHDRRSVVLDNSYVIGVTISSGWRTKEEISVMVDFFNSEETYLAINKKWVPVIMNPPSGELHNSLSDGTNSMAIECLFEQENNYSNVKNIGGGTGSGSGGGAST